MPADNRQPTTDNQFRCAVPAGADNAAGAVMGYDARLFERMRDALERKQGWSERDQFGGRVYVLNGNAFLGAVEDGLIALCGADACGRHLQMRHCAPFVWRGKGLPDWVLVDMSALKTAKQLSRWVEASYSHASELPPAKPARRSTRKRKT
jgi:hypothetical protein